ncbi:copper amine oxidase N-terminal domain-containing protein [uncultured Fenollaria sp.]|uniref:copper amine oxidase N-terminal domain-containing protein n=1 Tax=uncultured Fenollaria sp. TaxID=1686315 RepID=UPI0025CC4862|nr:copper amine oxidase N-terminal domain-containing protein [uncultured Fenollaria sp.]
MKKKFLLLSLFLLLLVLPFNSKAQNDIKININGQEISGDASPIIINGRTLVPLRLVSENLGLDVDWQPDTQEVTLTKGETVIKFVIGTNSYNKNGLDISMDIAAMIHKGRTYLPIRVIGECLDKNVDWDKKTRTVFIMDEGFVQKDDASSKKPDTKKYNPDNGSLLAYLKADGRIIGNIKSKIYHVPGGANYEKVSLKNAVFFNTEDEAIKAGYRKAKK